MRWNLTLNAVVSILATTSKVSLLFMVSNSISQLKWVWFLHRGTDVRPLSDAQVFDDASRGLLGSLIMLSNMKRIRNSMASIGAVITLLAVTYDPFLQQIISYEAVLKQQHKQDDQVLMHRARYFTAPISGIGDDYVSNTNTLRTLNAAYWNEAFPWNPQCATRNCTWPTFETLAWHSKCYEDKNWTFPDGCNVRLENLEAQPEARSIFCSPTTRSPFVFPGTPQNESSVLAVNLSMSYTDAGGWVEWTVPNLTVTFDSTMSFYDRIFGVDLLVPVNFTAPLMAFSAISLALQEDLSVAMNVTTCELDIFLDSYDLQMTNGIPNVTLLDSLQLIKQVNGTFDVENVFNAGPEPGGPRLSLISSTAQADNAWDVPNKTRADAAEYYQYVSYVYWREALITLLSVQLNSTSIFNFNDTGSPSNLTYDDLEEVVLTNSNADSAFVWYNQGAEHIMDKVAASMTQLMLDPTQNTNGTEPVYGRESLPVTLIRVSWLWMIYPYALCLISIVFFTVTVLVSKKTGAPLWKSSINAFLYHGISFDSDIRLPVLTTVPEMDAQAAVTRARLLPSGKEGRLMLETSVVRDSEDKANSLLVE